MYLFNLGLTVAMVRGYGSAIAAIHGGFQDGSSISNNTCLKKLLRGMFIQRPPLKKLVPSWDLGQVLKSLALPPYEPLAKASLLDLSIKTTFLIATATARRRSELHAMSIADGHIRWDLNGVRLVPHQGFLTKNQSPSFQPSDIFIPDIKSFSSVPEDKLWCPVRALKWYLARTKTLRNTISQLFMATTPPQRSVSRDTISRWIVRAIQLAVPNWTSSAESTPHAHDTRAVATSWAFFKGVPLQDILQAAAWKSPSTFVSCYLQDVLQTGRMALSTATRQ